MGSTSSEYRKRAQDAEAALLRVEALLDAKDARPRPVLFGGAKGPVLLTTDEVRAVLRGDR